MGVHYNSNRYAAMDGIRGFAVLLVFFVHFILPVVRDIYHNPPLTLKNADTLFFTFLFYLKNSHHGVDIFFILSGFLIVRLIIKNNNVFKYFVFLRDRIIRIYPAFIVSLIIATGIFSFNFRWFEFDLKTFLLNTVFAQSIVELGVKNYHVVTWSLFYEFAFYFTMPVLLMFIPLKAFRNMILLLLAIGFFLIPVSYIRFEGFLFGALIATFDDFELQKWADNMNDMSLIIGYVIIGIFRTFGAHHTYLYISFLIITSLMIVNICFGQGILKKLFSFRYLRYLGNISYSFYLYHTIALPLIFNYIIIRYFVDYTPPFLTVAIAFFLTFALSVIFAFCSFTFLERPYFIYKKNLMASQKITNHTKLG